MSENEKALQKAEVVLPQNLEDYAMTAETLIRQANIVREVVAKVMVKDVHYGLIPGCGKKPSLLKPGAEKLLVTFRLSPEIITEEVDMPCGHKQFNVKCNLVSIVTGAFIGSGVGSCTTMESKYRFRKAEQKCPECGEETIIKGKQEYGGGWLCFKKKGGCGAKFQDGDAVIENQEMGRVEHDNPADYYNTCLKMAKKRAQVDAVLTCTAASDEFTQDIEDLVSNGTMKPEAEKKSNKPDVKTPQETDPDKIKIDRVTQKHIFAQLDEASIERTAFKKFLKEEFKTETSTDILVIDLPKVEQFIADNSKC
jgi:hypothetical protein